MENRSITLARGTLPGKPEIAGNCYEKFVYAKSICIRQKQKAPHALLGIRERESFCLQEKLLF